MKTQTAIDHFGSISALAAALKIRPQAVSQWGEFVPKGRAYELQVLTAGRLAVETPSEGTDSVPIDPPPSKACLQAAGS